MWCGFETIFESFGKNKDNGSVHELVYTWDCDYFGFGFGRVCWKACLRRVFEDVRIKVEKYLGVWIMVGEGCHLLYQSSWVHGVHRIHGLA